MIKYCCEEFKERVDEYIIEIEDDSIMMQINVCGGDMYGIEIYYCPFCGSKLIIDDLKEEIEQRKLSIYPLSMYPSKIIGETKE